ncbi:MAG TPA: GNAT family N-acetyltransferase [Verrucomicrobiales bacterium]|nr:GNAT family N-acetyltransferase [Verrucomicrobiales bacterium]
MPREPDAPLDNRPCETGEAIQDNLARIWMMQTAGLQGSWESFPGLHRFHTGENRPERNGILQGAIPPGEYEHRIQETIALLQASSRPYTWQFRTDHTPAGFAKRLERSGIMGLYHQTGMFCDLGSAGEGWESGAREGCRVVRADNAERTGLWADVVAAAFGMRPQLDFASMERERKHLEERHEVCVRLLGYKESLPVGAVQVFGYGATAGIYSVGVLPSARRRGFGTAVTLAALWEARALGFRRAILVAAPAGASLYRRLGFRDRWTLGVHFWPGGA